MHFYKTSHIHTPIHTDFYAHSSLYYISNIYMLIPPKPQMSQLLLRKEKKKKNPTCPQSSKLWEYFTQKPSNAVLCKDCRLELAYHTTTSDFWALEMKASQSTLSRLHQHKDSSGPVQHTALWLKWRNSHAHGSIGLCHISGLVWLLTVPKHRNEALPAAQLPPCCTTAAINIW